MQFPTQLAQNTAAIKDASAETAAMAVASRAGQTPCARWAVRIYYTRALISATAEEGRLDDSELVEGITQENMARH